ncbi:hypothetical protein SPRG_06858 [Saprolegnia parasitica CBS 223.65]|uniref:Sulfatase-modifying factor enzyme-like domain-containing protein n=1 Tax=Saprolegnia parasitica (strain CBS 223.65) TaxID=695850 RepID=A0A067CEI3_SAPPC|nr:hypothetical protein SPRG_06858 [Saprolegnia parasitica CBS 223.65]KDO27590.1 hypothetical protein SPRG_06858 [Saprolegnia parasitica CBS 223.65]|eukprot:XP_012201715.1 hypothetical protein SPRG_06858 [Saprolegnia parasitica CBS 223.65]
MCPEIECTGVAGALVDSLELLPLTARRTYLLSLAHLTLEEAHTVLDPFASSYLRQDDVLLCTFPTSLVEPDAVLPVLTELLQPAGALECHKASLKDATNESLFLKAASVDADTKDGWYLIDTVLAPSAIDELLSPFYPAATWTNAQYATYLVQKPLLTLEPTVKASGLKHAPSLEDLENLWRSWDAKATAAPRSNQAPTLIEWESLWAALDVVMLQMLPSDHYLEAPVAGRPPFVYYIGHVPAFIDAHVAAAMDEPVTAPASMQDVFGADASATEWPDLDAIASYQEDVRTRIRLLYGNGLPSEMRRVLWLCFEQSALLLEAFLALLVQCDGVQPPPHLVHPRFAAPAPVAPASYVPIRSGDVVLGHDDVDGVDDHPSIPYGWDNERPSRTVEIDDSALYEMQSRPVTVAEYRAFLAATNDDAGVLQPASWTADGAHVKTVFGPVALELAAAWPVYVSFDQANAYATAVGLRLPHEAEMLAMRLPGTGHNVGLRHWVPTHVEENPAGWHAGNAWEWTCDVLGPHDGFAPSELCPVHTAAFFDGDHNVLVGASWATLPRIASRRTFRHWAPRTASDVFATFRCVKTTVSPQ